MTNCLNQSKGYLKWNSNHSVDFSGFYSRGSSKFAALKGAMQGILHGGSAFAVASFLWPSEVQVAQGVSRAFAAARAALGFRFRLGGLGFRVGNWV